MSVAVICTLVVGLIAWNQWLNERAILAKENEELEQQLIELGDAEQQKLSTKESRKKPKATERELRELEQGES